MIARAHRPVEPESTVSAPEVQGPQAAPEPATDGGEVHALFDTPNHRGIGDSVSGDPVTIHNVTFSPGDLAAVVDFVGPLVNLYRFDEPHLRMIQALLAGNVEDAAAWNDATGGLYSELAQDNESHFAGAGGFGATFAASMSMALSTARDALSEEEGSPGHAQKMDLARLHLYTAEHFLQDAFSAGHQLDPADIESKIDLNRPELLPILARVSHATWEQCSSIISCYGHVSPMGYDRIDTWFEWDELAVLAGEFKGADSVADGMRKAVHERLAISGVEVASEAHPEPWTLVGDHELSQDPTSVQVLQEALAEVRLALEMVTPGTDPAKESQALYQRFVPQPTGAGQQTVDTLIAAAFQDHDSIVLALTEAMVATIEDVMSTIVAESHGAVVKVDELPEAPHGAPTPEFPDPVCEPVPADPVCDQPEVELPECPAADPNWFDWARDEEPVPPPYARLR